MKERRRGEAYRLERGTGLAALRRLLAATAEARGEEAVVQWRCLAPGGAPGRRWCGSGAWWSSKQPVLGLFGSECRERGEKGSKWVCEGKKESDFSMVKLQQKRSDFFLREVVVCL